MILYKTLNADIETPVSLYLKLTQDKPYSFLYESVEQGRYRGRYSVLGGQPDAVWTCKNNQAYLNDILQEGAPLKSLRQFLAASRFESSKGFPDDLPSMAAGVFGNLGFDTIRMLESLPAAKENTLDIPDCCLFRPQLVAVMDHVKDTVTVCVARYQPQNTQENLEGLLEDALEELQFSIPAMPEKEPTEIVDPVSVESNFTKSEFKAVVERCKEYIRAGDVFQVVPSQRFQRPISLGSFKYYRKLRRINPSPYLFHIQFKDYALVGSSPEILVRVEDGEMTVRPIAGTRPRGKTLEEDAALAKDLLADPKERAEHLMLIDLGRNDLGRVSAAGSVQVTDQYTIEHYSHVMHIVSQAKGQLRKGKDCIDALLAGFPAGTVSGAPKIRAMEIINELEPQSRSFYGGGVGYFSAKNTDQGEMDTCIALRTALIKDGMLYVQAGCGVVADSDPEAEYTETVNKAMALLKAAE